MLSIRFFNPRLTETLIFADYASSFNWILDDLIGCKHNPATIIDADSQTSDPGSTDLLLVADFDSTKVDLLQNSCLLKQEAFKCAKLFRRIGLLVILDEFELISDSIYRHFDFVFRNHTYSYFSYPEHVYWFPLGYSSGYLSEPHAACEPASKREFFVNLIANLDAKIVNPHLNTEHVKPERGDCLRALNEIDQDQVFVHTTDRFHDTTSLSKQEYRQILRTSVFTLCPPGSSPESTRIYEALEVGSIPIIQENNKSLLFGNHPLPVVHGDWYSELPRLLQRLKACDRDDLQSKVLDWYARFKAKYQQLFREVLFEHDLDDFEYVMLAKKLRNNGDAASLDQAIRYLHKAIDLKCRSPKVLVDLYNQLGIAYSIRGDLISDGNQRISTYVKAIDLFQKIVTLDAVDVVELSNAHFNAALVFSKMSDHQNAKRHLERALALNPGSKQLLEMLQGLPIH